ncbi:MAG: hypothetical protein P8J32_00250 [bacterium]|jgi:hypothetical protein|nr:hypothetical protein [bacterium]
MEGVSLLTVISPGEVLFGLLVLLYGSAFTLSFLMGSKQEVIRPLSGVLLVILFLLLGVVAIEFSAAATPSYTYGSFASLSEALSTHRWLLFQLPIILTISGLIVMGVYHERLVDVHARMYRSFVQICIAVSFASLLVISFESMI